MSPEADSLIRCLSDAGSRLGYDLRAAEGLPLQTYLEGLHRFERRPAGPGFAKLKAALQTYLQTVGSPDPAKWVMALERHSIIQQADHSFLLLDSETLLNNALFALGGRAVGARALITIQCSTVSCIARRQPLRGSPFLSRKDGDWNIFNFSKRTYARSAFMGLPKPVRTDFASLVDARVTLRDDAFLGRFVGVEWPDALEAFREINRVLWQDLSVGLDVDLLIADDRLTFELIALHIEDRASPIHRLVFDAKAREVFLDLKRALIASSLNIGVNRAEPDHFWVMDAEGGRLRAMVFDAGRGQPRYETGDGLKAWPYPFTPVEVAAALRRGELVPDIILIYVARCLLAGVAAVGGASQQDYVALYQRLLLGCDTAIGLLTPLEREDVGRSSPSRLGGATLLEIDAPLAEAIHQLRPSSDLSSLFEIYLGRTVGQTIGRLDSAQYLAEHARRAIRRADIAEGRSL